MKRARKERAPAHMLKVPPRTLIANLAVLLACYVLLTSGMMLATSPERYDIKVGDIAPATITATKDVIDEITTEQRRTRAGEAVTPSYREDETALDTVMQGLAETYREFDAVRQYGEDLRNGVIRSAAGDDFVYMGTFPQEDLQVARDLVTKLELSDWRLTILMKQTAYDLSDAFNSANAIVAGAMESTIREGSLDAALSSIQKELTQFMSTEMCTNIVLPAVRANLVPNMIIDQEATEANRETARHDVEPYIYKSGQNIVVAGEKVTQAQLAMLETLGLLLGNRFDISTLAGVALLAALVMVALLFHILQFDAKTLSRPKNALMMGVIALVSLGLCVLIVQVNVYLAPISMVALLVASLLSPNLALTANTLSLIVLGILTNTTRTAFTQQMLSVLCAGALSAPVGIFVIRRKQQRASVLLAGLSMAVVNLFAMVAIGLLTSNQITPVLQNAVWFAGSAILASVLCMGVQPALEWMFDLVTPYKLLELANPNQPLLRRLLVETPGTYHHSILVANLSEAAAEAIGADPLLARVGAYYHDVGKLKRPLYFKENQMGDNPHDRTDPRVSAAIIAEHVTDGVLLAKQNHLPAAIIDFIEQHHGDTQISFFYQKMRAMEGGEKALPEDFQYPGPKPLTRETAIVMLADTAEAAVRAGGDQDAEVIENRIRDLVKGKIDGGQLNDCTLRFGDVTKIIHAFAQVLTGIYHKRIEYPKLTSPTAPAALPEAPPRHAVRILPVDEPAGQAQEGERANAADQQR